jgi:predicted MFS family arabinose efflux permease
MLPPLFEGWVAVQGSGALGILGFGGTRAAALRLTLLMSLPFGLLRLIPLALMKESYSRVLIPLRSVFMMKHVRNKATVGKLFIVSLLYAGGLWVYFPLLNLHFEHSFHIHSEEFGQIVALNNLAITIAMFAVPLIVARLGKLKTIVWSRLLGIPFLIALASSQTSSIATIIFVLRGALTGMARPVSGVFSMELVDENERATTAGFTHMTFDLLYGGMIFVGGLLLSIGSFWSVFVIASILYASNAILLWFFLRDPPGDA